MEIIALLAQVEAKKARDVSASDVDAHDGVGHGKAFVNGHGMGDTIPRVQHHTRGPAGGVTEAQGHSITHPCLLTLRRLSLLARVQGQLN